MKTSVQGSLMENHFENNRTNDCCRSGAHRRLLLKAGVAALAGALLVGCSGGNTPAAVAKAYITALFEGKIDEAMAMTANGAGLAQDPKIRAMFSSLPAMVAQKGGLNSIEVVSSEVKGDSATVRIRINYNNGTSDSEDKNDLNLVRVDGKWKVVIN